LSSPVLSLQKGFLQVIIGGGEGGGAGQVVEVKKSRRRDDIEANTLIDKPTPWMWISDRVVEDDWRKYTAVIYHH